MNRTEELIKILREYVDDIKDGVREYINSYVLTEVANTIEQLAAKVRAANMERSMAYYNGGWIPVKERLPEEYGEYLITWTTSQTKRPLIAICEYEITSEYDYKYSRFKGEWLLDDYIKNYPNVNVIAWMPLPLPFKEDKTE